MSKAKQTNPGACAPTMLARGPGTGGKDVELPIFYVDCEVEVQITMGFVYERISFLNTTGEAVDGMFMCPTNNGNATVCSCDMAYAGKTFSTSVIDADEDLERNEYMKGMSENGTGSFAYVPSCFSMPFAKLPKMSEIIVEIRYVQELAFDHFNGKYSLMVPMRFLNGNDSIFEKRSFSEAINYRVLLAPGTEDGNWECPTHQLDVTNVSPGPNNVGKVITLEGNGQNLNSDFVISYSAWANRVTGSVLCEADGKGGGSFMAFLQPPSFSIAKPLARKMVFLIDVSYSMTGQVLDNAKAALLAAMSDLQPHDYFALCAYDDKMRWYSSSMQEATSDAVEKANAWVRLLETTGMTDILQPIKAGTKLLQKAADVAYGHGSKGGFGMHNGPTGFSPANVDSPGPSAGRASGEEIPFLVLITDGAVYPNQENDILDFAENASRGREQAIRISTFGIGPYCNRYFLSNLSEAGMGYSETCLSLENVRERMVNFLSKTKAPVLAGISLNSNNLTVYPEKIPDLTVGAPLIIHGSYDGRFPSVLSISGITTDGPITIEISSSMAENAPIMKMVEKRRMESMIGNWYMHGKDDAKRQEIVEKSVAIGVPCVMTRTAAYENPEAMVVHRHEKHNVPEGWSDGSTTDTIPPPTSVHEKQHKRGNHPGAAAAAAGGVFIVGAGIVGALAFGNASATNANISVMDGMNIFNSEGFSGLDFMTGGGWGENILGTLGGGANDAMNFLSDAIPEAGGEVSGFCSDLCKPQGMFGELCGGCEPLGQIFDPCVDAAGQCCDSVGNCDLGGMYGGMGQFCAACCDGFGDIFNGLSDSCGDISIICATCAGEANNNATMCSNAFGGQCMESCGYCVEATGGAANDICEAGGGICECLGECLSSCD